MDVELHCYVCGQECSIEGVEEIVQVHGLQQNWSDVHHHTDQEMTDWRDSELAREEYMAKHFDIDDDDGHSSVS